MKQIFVSLLTIAALPIVAFACSSAPEDSSQEAQPIGTTAPTCHAVARTCHSEKSDWPDLSPNGDQHLQPALQAAGCTTPLSYYSGAKNEAQGVQVSMCPNNAIVRNAVEEAQDSPSDAYLFVETSTGRCPTCLPPLAPKHIWVAWYPGHLPVCPSSCKQPAM